MRWLRIVGWIVAVPVVLAVVAVLISVVLSPPRGGKTIAADVGAPYRAVVAHRGASGMAPEGTEPAYLLAREMGADYLEADLQRTKDGVIIVFHDDTPARTTNAAEVFPGRENDFIETFTYEELRRLDGGGWFNEAFPDRARPSFAGVGILTLEELSDIARSGSRPVGLYLETKASERHAGYEDDIVDTLIAAGWLDGGEPAFPLVFQSFNPDSLARLAARAPDVARILLISTETEAEFGWDRLLDVAAEVGHGIGPIGFLAWPWNTGSAHRRDLLVHPYVINETWQMRLLTLFGVDGFFTDHPERALAVFGRGAVDEEELFRNIGY